METYLAKWGFFGILSLDDCCERKDVQLDCHKDQKGKAGKHVFDFVCRKRSVANAVFPKSFACFFKTIFSVTPLISNSLGGQNVGQNAIFCRKNPLLKNRTMRSLVNFAKGTPTQGLSSAYQSNLF